MIRWDLWKLYNCWSNRATLIRRHKLKIKNKIRNSLRPANSSTRNYADKSAENTIHCWIRIASQARQGAYSSGQSAWISNQIWAGIHGSKCTRSTVEWKRWLYSIADNLNPGVTYLQQMRDLCGISLTHNGCFKLTGRGRGGGRSEEECTTLWSWDRVTSSVLERVHTAVGRASDTLKCEADVDGNALCNRLGMICEESLATSYTASFVSPICHYLPYTYAGVNRWEPDDFPTRQPSLDPTHIQLGTERDRTIRASEGI